MAGAYPDNPSRRLAYDESVADVWTATNNQQKDQSVGTVPFIVPYTLVTQDDRDNMNDEDRSTYFRIQGTNQGMWVTIMFEEAKDIDGGFSWYTQDNDRFHWLAYSTGTTNGIDGTWTTLGITTTHGTGIISFPSQDFHRDNISTTAISGVKAIMIFGGADDDGRFVHEHFFGVPDAGETPDRLLFLDPDDSDNEFTKPFDFGDVERGEDHDDTFKVRNNSSSLTANTVQMTGQDLFKGAGGWLTYDDGGGFTATLSIGNLASSTTYASTITVRNAIPTGTSPGIYTSRTKLTAASWS